MALHHDRSKKIDLVGAMPKFLRLHGFDLSPAALDEAASLLHEIESRLGVVVSYIIPETITAFWDDSWNQERLFAYFSEVGVIWAGDELTGFAIYNSEKQEVAATWRAWGDLVAQWANAHWFLRPVGFGNTKGTQMPRKWDYLDFYMKTYFDYLVSDYDNFLKSFAAVIRRKDEIFGLDQTANTSHP